MSIAKPPRMGCPACNGDLEVEQQPGGYAQAYPGGGVLVSCECGLVISLPFERGAGPEKSKRFKSLIVWLIRVGVGSLEGPKPEPDGVAFDVNKASMVANDALNRAASAHNVGEVATWSRAVESLVKAAAAWKAIS